MDAAYFLRGLALGFAIAAPVGPIGLLCIRRTLAEGRWTGLAAGLGAATADSLYGTVAAFGLTAISGFLTDYQTWMRIGGGIFLIYLGVRTFLSPPGVNKLPMTGRGYLGAWISTFFLTLSNPATILSFIAAFAGLGLAGNGRPVQSVGLVLGVFCGSAAWWLLLSSLVAVFRDRLGERGMRIVNKAAGICIVLFGFAIFGSLSIIW